MWGSREAAHCPAAVPTSYKWPLVKTGDAHVGVLQFVRIAVVVLSLAGNVQCRVHCFIAVWKTQSIVTLTQTIIKTDWHRAQSSHTDTSTYTVTEQSTHWHWEQHTVTENNQHTLTQRTINTMTLRTLNTLTHQHTLTQRTHTHQHTLTQRTINTHRHREQPTSYCVLFWDCLAMSSVVYAASLPSERHTPSGH